MNNPQNLHELVPWHQADGSLIRLVGCWDGLSAIMVQEMGFEGIWSSGFCISASHGLPDASVLTKSEFLERAREMRNTAQMPILHDMDTGYGGPAHIIQYIREFAAAGVNGVCIEDKLFPKSNSFVGGNQGLMGIEEFCKKIMAAKEAVDDMYIVARIEAFISGFGLQDAIYRADAYAESGADAILIHSKSKDGKDILEFLDKWKKRCPIVIVPTTYAGVIPEEEMRNYGVNIVIYANQLLRVMVDHGFKYLKELEGWGETDVPGYDLEDMKTLFALQGMDVFKELEKKYSI